MKGMRVVIIGGGIFGATAALELAARGHRVRLVDSGPLPHPRASSTDISKVIRPDYGSDDEYMDLMMDALDGWDRWNAEFARPLYHEHGFVVMSRGAMEPGSFEYESFERLRRRGVPVDRLDPPALRRRFPAWNASAYFDGYFNPRAGWAESGEVVRVLIERAREEGAEIVEGSGFGQWMERGSRVVGIRSTDGAEHPGDCVVLAAGAWTPVLLTEVSGMMTPIAQSVVHLAAGDAPLFRPPWFGCWAADISRTGWYGFPALADGTFKIGHHGPGKEAHPGDDLMVPETHIRSVREFVRETFPALSGALVKFTRVCLYCDTWDGNFYLDRHPDRAGLVVAAGGSGHAFKFAPVLGGLIADVVEEKANSWRHKFRWRSPATARREAARYHK